MLSDAELLHRYVTHHDEQAFTAFVLRHLAQVHNAAWRRCGEQAQVAEEVAQRVFCDVARKAAVLQNHPALTAWLHRSTRYLAIDALRADQRRQKLNEAFAVIEGPTQSEGAPDFAALRPVIDSALDELKEADREVVLLRYFGELTFPEIAQRLQLSESAARMRADRALEKLRLKLQRRGLVSTSAALGLALGHQMLAAPASTTLIGGTITASLTLQPATGVSALITFFSMNKIIIPLLGAAIAASMTTLVWTSVASTVSTAEIAKLRAENVELKAATAPGADSALAERWVSNRNHRITVATQEVEKQIATRRVGAGATSARSKAEDKGYRNLGMATPKDAWMTFAWACNSFDTATVSKMIWMDPPARQKAEEILSGMPVSVRSQFKTPEELYAFFYTADALIAPPPGSDVVESFQLVEIAPGRYAARQPGSSRNYHELQQTPEGWKDVLPLNGVVGMAHTLDNPTLVQLTQH